MKALVVREHHGRRPDLPENAPFDRPEYTTMTTEPL